MTERFDQRDTFHAAELYYRNGLSQAEVATRMGVSRPTVSRMLSQARQTGLVRIDLVPPSAPAGVAAQVERALSLQKVYVVAGEAKSGARLAAELDRAITDLGLTRGDVLLVSSGRAVSEAIPEMRVLVPGVSVVPTLGGLYEDEPWYRTNEIATSLAAVLSGRALPLASPAIPGERLLATLADEPGIERTREAWSVARAAILAIGAAIQSRESVPAHLPVGDPGLDRAVGDITSRFFDSRGRPLHYAGDDRLQAISLEMLRDVPGSVGVGMGTVKVEAIRAAVRGGYITRLVTDEPTARALIETRQPGEAHE